MSASSDLPALIERWFTDRLIRHHGSSANTIPSYRDTFRLLFTFAHDRLGQPPSKLGLTDIDAPFISAFLNDLEARRSATAQTRILRLTAIQSFFCYASFEAPGHSAHIQRVLAIPTKRCDKQQLHFLTALRSMPSSLAPTGRPGSDGMITHYCCSRCKKALRVSELVWLDRHAVTLGHGAHVRCIGKGRKERCTPLTKTAQQVLRAWLREPPRLGTTAVFPNIQGGPLSTDGVQSLLSKYVALARTDCASLKSKRVSPHVLRHTAAMELLQAGVDCSVIALWLGHESIETTQTYLHARVEFKEAALAKLKPYERQRAKHFQPNDRLLEFLNAL